MSAAVDPVNEAQVSPIATTAGQLPPSIPPASTFSRILAFIGIWGMAISQPFFEQLRTHTAFIHDSHTPTEFLWFCVFSVSLGIPLGLGLFAALIGRLSQRWCRWLLRVLHLSVWTLLLLQVSQNLPLNLMCVMLPTVVGGLLWLTERSGRFRQGLQALAIGVIAFPALFISGESVHPLFFPRHARTSSSSTGLPVPVVMIVFDEFSGTTLWNRQREIDATLFPNFARLAREGNWYRNATSVHSATAFAMPSLLSGMYPPLPPADEFIPGQTLFDSLIDQNGYNGLVLEPVTRFCQTPNLREIDSGRVDPFDGREFLWHVGLAYAHQVVPTELLWRGALPGIDEVWHGVCKRPMNVNVLRGVARYPWNGPRPIQLQHFLNGLTPTTDGAGHDWPTLYFLHAVLPHIPWSQDANGKYCTTETSMWDFPRPAEFGIGYGNQARDTWPNDPLFTAQSQWRYQWQAQYADKFIGQVRERLIESGLYDRCLMVVMADHGVSFRSGDRRRTATSTNQVDIISIPLFIKLPGQTTGQIVDEPVEAIDAFPTILDVLQVQSVPRVDGRSIVKPDTTRRPGKRFVNQDTGLLLLSPDYPVQVPQADWPLLSNQVADRVAELGDPGHRTGRLVSEFKQGPPLDCQIDWMPGVVRGRERVAGKTLYLAGQIQIGLPPTEGSPGTLSPPPAPLTLALALDGKIVCVTRTFLERREAGLFQMLLPGDQHGPAKHAALFVVEDDKGETVLRSCPWPK